MSSVNKKEIEKFSKIAEEWWDPNGKFKPLHKFNPVVTAKYSPANGSICKMIPMPMNHLSQGMQVVQYQNIRCRHFLL